ncbi:MAG: hypothetical protein JWO81_240 [Alphaproteobacteria bacterium]|nr:hypothetical protein [Alphaproteobacteria bacterium]
MDSPADPQPDDLLTGALRRVLGRAMGVRLFAAGAAAPARPAQSAALWLTLFVAIWAGLHLLDPAPERIPGQIASLLGWGALYFAAALYLAQSTTERIYNIVERDILPHASERYKAAVAESLVRSYPLARLFGIPLLVALAAIVAAHRTLAFDLSPHIPAWPRAPETWLWVISYLIYFWTAAIAVVAARFYRIFAKHLELDQDRFYVLGAADTPLVKGLARLGTQVLIFWVFIFLATLSSMVLAVLPTGWNLPPDSWLLFLMVPVCGFFSLGFGSIVYLESEDVIRSTLQRFTNEAASKLQAASNALLDPRSGKVPDSRERLDLLAGWHDRILEGGRYGSRIRAAVSIALPLLLPVASIIVQIFKSHP